MKVVVLGAGGLLGRHLVDALSPVGDHTLEVLALGRDRCDITHADQVLVKTSGAGLIINCAAFTNVDACESDEDGAYRANALGAENVARAAAQHRARLVHVSTDFVFDGTQAEPYDEFATPRPLSVYARSKWAGEQLVTRACAEVYLVRVQGLYGRGGANFASKLRQLLIAQTPLKLDGERRVQPTWARAAALQILRLTETEHFGTYHVSCVGETHWAGFAARMAEKLRVAPRWQVVATAALAAPAARPLNCLFRHRMLGLHGLDTLPSWEVAQDAYLSVEAEAS
jgi:dTDP-4-dehydrorhamnose reductase